VTVTAADGTIMAMNGHSFGWNEVRKNRQTGVFEAVG
jgi:hypothetical protein